MAAPYSISKTSFLKFEQCEKAFFLYKNHPYLRDKPDTDRLLSFQRGHDVGAFAQQLFPGGKDVSALTSNAGQALELTKQLLDEGATVLYEATFVYQGVLVMLDILTFDGSRYTAYEVKSSLKVSDTYVKDACLQYYVLRHCVPAVDDFFLVTLNGDYQLQGDPDPKQLFKRRSVKKKAEENLSFFEHRLTRAHELLEKNAIPNIAIGQHCFRPYQCDFMGSCWKQTLGPDSIFNLPLVHKDKLFELQAAGIHTIEQVQDAHLEKERLIRVKNAFAGGRPVVDLPKLEEFIHHLQAPIAAMDMEIWNPAIPALQGCKPFEQIPFLVCFHNGQSATHFFTGHAGDQRRDFAEALLQLAAPYQTLLVYDKTMELIAIDNLAKRFDDLRPALLALKEKVADVFELFLNLHYYDPAFKSNFSLKTVAGSLVPDLNYATIASGMEAMSYYERYRNAEAAEARKQLQDDLVAYCSTDALATLRVVEVLKNLVTAGTF